jgi:hypothetical protein
MASNRWEATEQAVQVRKAESELSQLVEAADRAGALVEEQVRSIMEAAEAKAIEVEETAKQDSLERREEATNAANGFVEQIEFLERELNGFVENLHREADKLKAALRKEASNA